MIGRVINDSYRPADQSQEGDGDDHVHERSGHKIRKRCHFGRERNSSGLPVWFSSGVSPAMRT